MPLMGMIGMMKKSVTKSIPCFLVKLPTVPQFPQRICSGATCEPQEKKCVPMMKKKNMVGLCSRRSGLDASLHFVS